MAASIIEYNPECMVPKHSYPGISDTSDFYGRIKSPILDEPKEMKQFQANSSGNSSISGKKRFYLKLKFQGGEVRNVFLSRGNHVHDLFAYITNTPSLLELAVSGGDAVGSSHGCVLSTEDRPMWQLWEGEIFGFAPTSTSNDITAISHIPVLSELFSEYETIMINIATLESIALARKERGMAVAAYMSRCSTAAEAAETEAVRTKALAVIYSKGDIVLYRRKTRPVFVDAGTDTGTGTGTVDSPTPVPPGLGALSLSEQPPSVPNPTNNEEQTPTAPQYARVLDVHHDDYPNIYYTLALLSPPEFTVGTSASAIIHISALKQTVLRPPGESAGLILGAVSDQSNLASKEVQTDGARMAMVAPYHCAPSMPAQAGIDIRIEYNHFQYFLTCVPTSNKCLSARVKSTSSSTTTASIATGTGAKTTAVNAGSITGISGNTHMTVGDLRKFITQETFGLIDTNATIDPTTNNTTTTINNISDGPQYKLNIFFKNKPLKNENKSLSNCGITRGARLVIG